MASPSVTNPVLIPRSCTVLVIGGGPGGSYAAAALAREGVDVVLLEAEIFPRYHIGESMLASVRYFLRFIDLEDTFETYGFQKKVGAAFKLNHEKEEGWTDFIAVNGPKGYAWNVVRSEADHLMFKHAAKSGAKTFDGVKVQSIKFDNAIDGTAGESLGRPIAATWTSKDGASADIHFEYLVDASGRNGIISTKYMKNRKYNKGLKNMAKWGYWKGVKPYAPGTSRQGAPFFEALTGDLQNLPSPNVRLTTYDTDGSGWVWKIPLHNDTTSIGVVMRQDLVTAKRKQSSEISEVEFYKLCLRSAPNILETLDEAVLTSKVDSASDWSYSASAYASPYIRIVGDAGCFIDPFFSSGVHLALSSALSAAATIQAARRGDCTETSAIQWHTDRVSDGYHRFLLVVLTSLRQIRGQTQPLLNDFDEAGFEKAFAAFRPVIQGSADTKTEKQLTQEEVEATIDFCLACDNKLTPDDERKIQERLLHIKTGNPERAVTVQDLEQLTAEEREIFNTMSAKQMLRRQDTMNTASLERLALNGYVLRLERGHLGLAAS